MNKVDMDIYFISEFFMLLAVPDDFDFGNDLA